jgi:hypothetical protein
MDVSQWPLGIVRWNGTKGVLQSLPHPFGKQAADAKENQWDYSVTTWGTRGPRRRLEQPEIPTKTIPKRSATTVDIPHDSTLMRVIVRPIEKYCDFVA